MSFALLWCVSVVAGLVGAMTGLGGGVVLIPALTLGGTNIKSAIAVSLLAVIIISNSAASHFVRRHLPNLRAEAFFEPFAVAGSLAGALMTVILSPRPLFFLCGSVMLVSCGALWRLRKQSWHPIDDQDSLSARLGFQGSYYDSAEQRTIAYRGRRAGLAGPLFFGSGVISGWLGMGSSALTVLINNLVVGLPPKVSVTMSNLMIGVMALAGASVYLEAGLITLRVAVPVILGVPLGALIGSKLVVGLTNRFVHNIVMGVVFVLGIELIVQGLKGL